jgi:apolipoprotein D and lipocalin family protein
MAAKALTASLVLFSMTALSGAQNVETVATVDLDRYVGDWYEVARFPNRFQDQCAGDVRVTYGRRPDGRIDVTNRCRKRDGELDVAEGIARIVDTETNAKLEVRFLATDGVGRLLDCRARRRLPLGRCR